MRKKLLLHLSCLLALGISVPLSAQQQVVANAGGEGLAAGTNLQWTLGECLTQTSDVVAGAQLTQGFQQPSYEIQSVVEDPDLSFAIDVFPMPASDFLIIKTGSDGSPGLTAVFYDLDGRIMVRQDLHIGENTVDMQPFPAAPYVLNVSDVNGKLLKSFKIVKQ